MKSKLSQFIKVGFVMAMLPLSQNMGTTLTKTVDEGQIRSKEKLDFGESEMIVPEVATLVDTSLSSAPRVQTTFNMKNYFQNLSDYSAINNIGSCGYVSLTQTMSYYDTFFNDNVIPEQYDRNFKEATTEAEVKLRSPGIMHQSYYSSGYDSYYSYVHATADTDLQSRLTLEHNIDKNTDNPTNFTYSIGAWDYYPIVSKVMYSNYSSYNEFNINHQSVGSLDTQQAAAKAYIKEKIDQNIPVIIHISSPGGSAHSVVAYDYDDTNIYANYGWGASYNHVPLLGTAGYNKIYYLAAFDYQWTLHQHSDNYVINGNTYSGCNHNEFLINLNDDNINARPRLMWGGMEDFIMSRPVTAYYIYFYDMNGDWIASDSLWDQTSPINIKLISEDAWSQIVQAPGTTYSVQIVLGNPDLDTNVFESAMYTFEKPSNSTAHTILPNQYGFAPQYYFTEMTANHTIDGLSFQTKRLRTGFIENSAIVMSPRRADAGVAYLDYIFSAPVRSIEFDIYAWSNDEKLNASDSALRLEYKNQNGQWEVEIDFSISSLQSTSRTNPWDMYIIFPAGVREFRFYTTAPAIGASKNTGRTCIGELDIVMAY